MDQLTPVAAASAFRRIVADLSARSTIDPGALVDSLSPERAAALANRLDRLGDDPASGVATHDSFDGDHVVTIDSWIRIADSATLSDDVAEAGERTSMAAELRAIRALIAPTTTVLTQDPRET